MRRLFFTLLLVTLQAPVLQAQQLMAGAAQKLINPEKDSLYFAGGKPNRPFIDVHDNLYAKAVVLQDAHTAIGIITFDCIGLMYPELEKIRQLVKQRIPDFPTEHLVSSSTHTHAGPDVVGIWGKDFLNTGIVESHMNLITERAAMAVEAAWTNRKKVSIHHASGDYGEDWVKNISEPELLDRKLTVLRLVDNERKNVATLVNFACHPTILDDFATAASADYVGGYYRYADSVQGGVNMFLQGAIGGWVQPEDVPSSYSNAMKYGQALGTFALQLLQRSVPLKSTKLLFRSAAVNFPVENKTFKTLSGMGVIRRSFADSVRSEIAFFRIGDASFVTHPGETSPALGLYSRKLAERGGPVMVMGLSMDALGYILKPVYFSQGNEIPHSEYLTGMSIGPETMPIIERVLRKLTEAK
jgi:hypothetical protein